MILNYSKWKSLNEQKVVGHLSYSPYTTPESKEVFRLFYTEFIRPLIPGFEKMTPPQVMQALSKIPEQKLAEASTFFANKGYKQPNPAIKQLQEDLMKVTDYKSFTNTDNKTGEFNDGVFGAATAKAVISVKMKDLQRLGKDRTMDAVGQQADDAKKTPFLGQSEAPKVKTGEEVALKNTGTQSIPGK